MVPVFKLFVIWRERQSKNAWTGWWTDQRACNEMCSFPWRANLLGSCHCLSHSTLLLEPDSGIFRPPGPHPRGCGHWHWVNNKNDRERVTWEVGQQSCSSPGFVLGCVPECSCLLLGSLHPDTGAGGIFICIQLNNKQPKEKLHCFI